MEKLNQNQNQANNIGESKLQPALLNKPKQRYYIKVGAAIFVVIVLHFVSQFTFLRNENIQIEETSAKIENKQENKQTVENKPEVEVKPDYEAKNLNIPTTPVSVAVPKISEDEPKDAPSRAMPKKKELRESKAERLRRAEKILTGV